MPLPTSWSSPLPQPEAEYIRRATARQDQLTKPRGSLGLLEQLAIQMAGLQATDRPATHPACITIFAADHGVCEEGVSAYPQAVTAQMIANFATGGAAISVLARQWNASLDVVNLGTVGAVAEGPGIHNECIAPCTANLAAREAMSEEQLEAALNAGDRAAERAYQSGCRVFIGGEMGIGNTTSATAIACVLLKQPPETLTGPGTGLDAKGVAHKQQVISRALARHGKDDSPYRVLQSLGGFEIAALTGAILGCAARRIPVLIDGFIVSVAALVALTQQPSVRPWLFFGHQSEPGHQAVLEALDARSLLALGMRLGEGSGAAVALPLLQSACALHSSMASFDEAGVTDKDT
jgi:nicotinate-nucleotide--dimethylbenzimidazole phosphoribosyltransferase